jgi:hypothetical protein
MKREYIYILVIVILSLSGVFYKTFFLSGTIENTQILIEKNADESAKFYRDSLVQVNKTNIKNNFSENRRDARSYGEVVVELLSFTENMLKSSGATYKVNDINQDIDEVKDYKNGTSSFFINVSFNAEYKNIKNLMASIENSSMIINVKELELYREKVSAGEDSKKDLEDQGISFDEYNEKANIIVRLRLEFVKFL